CLRRAGARGEPGRGGGGFAHGGVRPRPHGAPAGGVAPSLPVRGPGGAGLLRGARGARARGRRWRARGRGSDRGDARAGGACGGGAAQEVRDPVDDARRNRSRVSLTPDWRPRLSPRARLREDARRGEVLLLYPERGLLLNSTAAAIARLLTGEH